MNDRMRNYLFMACAAATLFALVGCASPGLVKQHHPVWPAPPVPPRVIHRQDIRSSGDLQETSALSGLGRLITGGKRQAMLRPHSAAVIDDRLLCVTDQELQGVHVIDLNTSKARFIGRVDGVHFVSPLGVAAFGGGIAVSDSALNRVFLMTVKGEPLGLIDKPGGFKRPTGLAYDARHRELYVVDTLAHEVCVFGIDGRLVRRFGGLGTDVQRFNYPTHIFVDTRGRVFVTDSMNFRVQAFDRAGRYLFDLGAHGDASGYLAVPKGVGVDSFGHIYVVDSYFSNVQVFDEQGRFLLSIGGPGEDSGRLQVPAGLTVDNHNRIYVCDSYNRRVQVFEYIGDVDHENDAASDN